MPRRLLALTSILLVALCLAGGAAAEWPDAAPQPPLWVGAEQGTTGSIRVIWLSSSGATSYKVFRSYTETSTKVYKATTASGNREWYDGSATSGHHYFYWIQACNGDGCSGYGGPAEGWRYDAPPAPTGVTATDGTRVGEVRIMWTASPGATSHEVWRSELLTGPKTQLGTVSMTSLHAGAGTTYDDNTAVAETTYYYWVRGCITGGCGDFGPSDTGYHEPLPDVPTGLDASDGDYDDRVLVNWSSTYGTTDYYQVYRAESQAGAKVLIGTATNSHYYDGAVPSTRYAYWYFVKACTNEGMCSDYSQGDSGYQLDDPPPAPDWVQASDGNNPGYVFVNWQTDYGWPGPEATYFRIYKGDPCHAPGAGFVTNSNGYWSDYAVVGQTVYTYWVQGCNVQGCGDSSPCDTGFPGVPPDPPPNVQASDGTYTGFVRITWDPATIPQGSDLMNYKVFRADSPTGHKECISGGYIAQTSYDDDTAIPEVVYTYWVMANSNHGDSGYSDPDQGHRADLQPTPGSTPSWTPTLRPSATATVTRRPSITPGPSATPTLTVTPRPTRENAGPLYLPMISVTK